MLRPALLPFLLLLWLAAPPAAAQHMYFENLSGKNGLSQNTVRCMLQDRKGFIWLGTEDGLNRYDGLNIRIYRHDEEDSTSLADDMVHELPEPQAQRR